MADQGNENFLLFKGATRPATFGGVPTTPLLIMICFVAALAMVFHLLLMIVIPFFWAVMASITKHDSGAFRIWYLWWITKRRNKNKAYWKASSYSPRPYKRERR